MAVSQTESPFPTELVVDRHDRARSLHEPQWKRHRTESRRPAISQRLLSSGSEVRVLPRALLPDRKDDPHWGAHLPLGHQRRTGRPLACEASRDFRATRFIPLVEGRLRPRTLEDYARLAGFARDSGKKSKGFCLKSSAAAPASSGGNEKRPFPRVAGRAGQARTCAGGMSPRKKRVQAGTATPSIEHLSASALTVADMWRSTVLVRAE
jgi:hypothetical protein